MIDYYDRSGKKITNLEACSLLKNEEYRSIRKNYSKDFFISTVWLGLDYNFSDSNLPIIFETTIFGKSPDGVVNYGDKKLCSRYSTEEEAIKGHIKACKEYNIIIEAYLESAESRFKKINFE